MTPIRRRRRWKPGARRRPSFAPSPRWKRPMSEALRLLFVDNFDSFPWNLVDEFARRGAGVEVWRNTTPPEHLLGRAQGGKSLFVLSPGPGAPADAGCCIGLVRGAAAARIPL